MNWFRIKSRIKLHHVAVINLSFNNCVLTTYLKYVRKISFNNNSNDTRRRRLRITRYFLEGIVCRSTSSSQYQTRSSNPFENTSKYVIRSKAGQPRHSTINNTLNMEGSYFIIWMIFFMFVLCFPLNVYTASMYMFEGLSANKTSSYYHF